jgi:hypothetical protein
MCVCVCLCFISEITDPVLVKFDKGNESDFEQYQLTSYITMSCIIWNSDGDFLWRWVMIIISIRWSWKP